MEHLGTVQTGEVAIDMDEIADAVAKGATKPDFYYAEESQQNQYTCTQCTAFNDILGKVGYCTGCGTRNDLEVLKNNIASIREEINSGSSYERYLQTIVSKFDSFIRQYVKELLRIPMSKRRRGLLEGKVNHDLERTADALKDAFDINITKRLKQSQRDACVKIFHRRHVYEHNGGEVDEVYLKATGDDVRLKQALSETQESVNILATCVLNMAEELHKGFHEIFPPLGGPIKDHRDRLERIKRT
jgi:vacuolar-type H+-ATPase subunit I/STV1